MRNIYFYSFSLIFLFIAICGNIITSKSVPETVIVFVDEQDRSYTFEPCIYYWNAINHYPDFIIKKRIDDGIIKAMHLSEAHQKKFQLDEKCKESGYGSGILKSLVVKWLEDFGLLKKNKEWWE